MQTSSRDSKRTPPNKRKGIKISQQAHELYNQRNPKLDKDPDTSPLPPEKWANAMRRDEFFRPRKMQTTVRIDADVLAWLRSKGQGHISRINDILRQAMMDDWKRP
jgi:uncharacterized protein (DUF4415 family)